MKKNVLLFMKEFEKILSFTNQLGFFFGAGTSCAFGLPSIKDLTESVLSELIDEQNLIEIVINDLKALKDNVTIEDILNQLRLIRSVTHDGKDEFKGVSGSCAAQLDSKICTEIYKNLTQKQDVSDITDMRRFLTWYVSANRNFIKEIYTTNYDLLIEESLEENYTPYLDGFIGSKEPFFSNEIVSVFPNLNDSTCNWLRLWKLHGSLNWYEKKEENKTKIIRGKREESNHELMIYPSREKYELSRKTPFIAYFDRLKKYLENEDKVFIIIGYSFSDQHINEIFFDAMRQNKGLYIAAIVYSDETVDFLSEYCKSFFNFVVLGPTKMISNGSLNLWDYDSSSVKDDLEKYYWDEGKFVLGDFKKLIDFLIEHSGKRDLIKEIVNSER